MTEQEIKLVERLWASGEPTTAIVRLLPYDTQTAKAMIMELRQKGVLKGRSGKSRANTQARVLQAYYDGITSKYDIAEMLGLNVDYVNILLSNAKLGRTRPKRNYKKRKLCENTNAIIEQLQSGKTAREICTEFGVSTQYVYKVKNTFLKEQDNER